MKVPAPNEEEAVQVIQGVRERYEKFHAVSYTDEALRYSVYLSNRYIPDRFLPDKAIDLIDEAGARQAPPGHSPGRGRRSAEAREVHHASHGNGDHNHEFEKARFYSEEERKEKENLRTLRERYKLDDASTGIVSREDIEEVVSRWTGIGVTSIKEDEQQKLLRIEPELHKRVIARTKPLPPWLAPFAAAGPASNHHCAQLAASSFLVPRASERPKSRGGLRNSCSVRRSRWYVSICRSSWKSTPFRNSSARLRGMPAAQKAGS